MNRHTIASIFVVSVLLFGACRKNPLQSLNPKGKILVDASKDGGVWWFPASGITAYSPSNDHQGRKLANYLRKLGYQVDELPTGTTVTWSQLKEYSRVIRAWGGSNYSPQELSAYDSLLNRGSSLLLLSEYIRPNEHDNLSEHLGLKLAGEIQGSITSFQPHPVTQGVTSINYIMGSAAVVKRETDNITALGWLNGNNAIVMGILHHPKSKIFFIGDANGIEQVPQPLVNNLVEWMY